MCVRVHPDRNLQMFNIWSALSQDGKRTTCPKPGALMRREIGGGGGGEPSSPGKGDEKAGQSDGRKQERTAGEGGS